MEGPSSREFELDHLVWAVPDLQEGVKQLQVALGIELSPGGSHLGLGTANFILGLGNGSYLEVIGPDPLQPEHVGPRPFDVDAVAPPRLATFAVRVEDIEASSERLRTGGYDPGAWHDMQRVLPGGEVLGWKLTRAPTWGGGVVPFLIEWGDAVHPSSGTQGARLERMDAAHPDPRRVSDAWAAMGLEFYVSHDLKPHLRAFVRGPAGALRLDGWRAALGPAE